jgi:hypothetical protein
MIICGLSLFIEFNASLFSNEWLRAQCGLDSSTFLYIYNRYCRDSIIDSQLKLYRLFHYLKLYPVVRAHELKSLSSINKYIEHLASVVDELSSVWNHRHNMINRTPHHFRHMLTGSIDSFPVVVSRPVDSKIQSYLYNGKYKKHVMKVTHSFIFDVAVAIKACWLML